MRLLRLTTLAGLPTFAVNERPLAKIIKLLKNMSVQMEAEVEDDDAVHKKYQCWCDKEKEEKTAIVKKQSAEMKRQDAAAKGAFAESQKKSEKRVLTFNEQNAKQTAAEQLRTKCMEEKTEFSKADQDIEKSIIACKNALTILKKHNFLQGGKSADLNSAVTAFLDSPTVQNKLLIEESSAAKIATLMNFIQGPGGSSFLQQSPGFGSYANQSGQIFGILGQMLEDLTRDQSSSAKEEKERRKACTNGAAAFAKEISLLSDTLAALDARLGELATTQGNAKEDFAAAKEAHGNAVSFLGKLDTQCSKNQADWESRTKSRAEELIAIKDTIEILDNDKAFAAMGDALGTTASSFIQMSKQAVKQRNVVINEELRRSAVAALDSFATKSPNVFLVQYLIKSAAVDKNALKKVTEKIDILVGEMQEQQKEEIKQRDVCLVDLNQNKLDLEEKARDKTTSEEELESLEGELEAVATSLEETEAASAKLRKEQAEADKERKEDSAEFQKVQAEQQEAQKILQMAIDRMNAAYSKMQVAYSLAEKEEKIGADFTGVESSDDTPGSGPAAFTNEGKTEQNKGGNKVITLLKEVLADSQKVEKEATQAEQDAQDAYEQFSGETSRTLANNDVTISKKTKRRGVAEGLKVDAQEMIRSLGKGQFDLTEENKAIHGRCGFLLNNFDGRMKARENEMNALNEAKHILQGMGA